MTLPIPADALKQHLIALGILSTLLDEGAEYSREELANATGYSVKSSAFKNPLSKLNTKGLISYPRTGHVKMIEWLAEL